MLGFFRKYQKFFFIFVTVVIVISFVFFGTFSTLMNSGRGEITEKMVLTHLLQEEEKIPLLFQGLPIKKESPEATAQFIIDASAIAEKRGYETTNEEAGKDLYQTIYVSLIKYLKGGENPSPYVEHQIRSFGVEQTSLVKAWKKMVLLKHLYEEATSAIFVDTLFNEQLAEFSQGVSYELPQHLRFKDFREMLKLQVYIDGVSKTKNSLLLPSTYLTPDEIERRTPELVERAFQIEYAEVNTDNLAARISLKEIWDWEVQKEGYSFEALEKMESKERVDLDQKVRKKILGGHPEWIAQALATAPMTKAKVSIRGKGSHHPFKGTEDPKQVLSLLLSEKTEGNFDQKHYYRFNVLEKPAKKTMLTFTKALEDGTLDELLTKKLKSGDDADGTKVYADLLQAIRGDKKVEGLDYYVEHRLDAFKKEAQKHPEKVDAQWALIKTPSKDENRTAIAKAKLEREAKRLITQNLTKEIYEQHSR